MTEEVRLPRRCAPRNDKIRVGEVLTSNCFLTLASPRATKVAPTHK